MVSLKLAQPSKKTHDLQLNKEDLGFLNLLRFVSMGCRSKRRTDLFEACALLQVSRSSSREAYADALVRCLGDAVGKRIILYTPGTLELSFDEAWLLQLARALTRGDDASSAFLLNSRVAREHRRLVRYLVGSISECFSLI